MPIPTVAPATARKPRGRRKRKFRLLRFWPNARTRRRWIKGFRALPPTWQATMVIACILAAWLASNWMYQVVRKPSELFFPVSGALNKMPTETWREYGSLFEDHATSTITPELLAALAQVEASGNPVARTYWRWSLQRKPFDMYRPASSAVGMYQFTDSTFEEARQYCVHDHVVVEDGPWTDFHACWFNSLYARTIPSNAIELASAYLDRSIANILRRHRIGSATPEQKQNLAAMIHLCGAGAGDQYARRRFHLLPNQRCGDHYAQVYLSRVESMRKVFRGLRAKGE